MDIKSKYYILCDSKGTRTRSSPKAKTKAPRIIEVLLSGADYGARTRHLHLGKVALYQMS